MASEVWEGIPRDRVVAVIAILSGNREQVGSGYLVGGRLVLTAEHCTRDILRERAVLRLRVIRASDGSSVDVAATVASPAVDVAVLQLANSAPWTSELAAPAYARVNRQQTGQLVDCEAMGYPLMQRDPVKKTRDTAELHGTIYQTDEAESGRLLMREPLIGSGHVPAPSSADTALGDTLDRTSPWDGFSGALVFYHGRAIGVVVEHHPRQGESALRAVPFDTIAKKATTDASTQFVAKMLGLPAEEMLPWATATEIKIRTVATPAQSCAAALFPPERSPASQEKAMTVDEAIQALREILSEYIYEKDEAIRIVRHSKTPVVWSGDQISFWDKVLNNVHRSSRMAKLFASADEVLGDNSDWQTAKRDYLSACEADRCTRKRNADDKGSGVVNVALNERYLRELGDALGGIEPKHFRDPRISDQKLKAASKALLAVEPMAAVLHAEAEAETREPRLYRLQQADYALTTHHKEVADTLSALQKVSSEKAAKPLCDVLAQQADALLTAYAQAITHVT
jgi:hypothetical protein